MINKIKSKRALLDWTQQDLANALGINVMSISYYENGTNSPNIIICLKMADLFNCEVGEIFELTEKEKQLIN